MQKLESVIDKIEGLLARERNNNEVITNLQRKQVLNHETYRKIENIEKQVHNNTATLGEPERSLAEAAKATQGLANRYLNVENGLVEQARETK